MDLIETTFALGMDWAIASRIALSTASSGSRSSAGNMAVIKLIISERVANKAITEIKATKHTMGNPTSLLDALDPLAASV